MQILTESLAARALILETRSLLSSSKNEGSLRREAMNFPWSDGIFAWDFVSWQRSKKSAALWSCWDTIDFEASEAMNSAGSMVVMAALLPLRVSASRMTDAFWMATLKKS